MPRVAKYCVKSVKDEIFNSCYKHTCNTVKCPYMVKGKVLNGFLKSKKFKRDTEYRVCSNLKVKMGDYEPPPSRNNKRTQPSSEHNTRNNSTKMEVESLKRIRVRVPGTDDVFEEISLEPAEMSLDPPENFTDNPSQSFRDKFKKTLIDIKNTNYRKKYRECAVKKRRERAKTLGNNVIAMCMDSAQVRSNFDSYLKTDVEIAIDINMVLDDCRDYMSVKLRRQFSDVPDNIPASPPPIEDEDETSKNLVDVNKYSLAVALLGSTTKNKYNLLRDLICTAVGLSKKDMPSYHTLTKNRPSIVGEVLTPLKDLFIEPVPVPERPVGSIEKMFEEQLELLEQIYDGDEDEIIELEQKEIISGKIEGGYQKYIDLIINKYEDAKIPLNESLIAIDSYDGALHCNSNKGRTNVVSFSTQLLSSDTVRSGKSPAGSFGILTWQQIIAEEKIDNVFPICR